MANEMAAEVDVVLVDADTAAAMCSMHRGTWYKKSAAGKVPKPIRIDGMVRWRKAELEAWIVAGCPPRGKWERIYGQN